MQIYDLHCHSNYSDGILSPKALVSRAKEQNVGVLSLTDHDTIDGLNQAASEASCVGLRLIPGIEFSCQWQGRGIHVVGLNFDPTSPILLAGVERQRQLRLARAELIAEKLFKAGIPGALDGAKHYAKGASIGRPHFAQYLVDTGYVSSVNQAFKKYLGAGKVGDVKQVWPEIHEVVAWINGAGGCAVIAHPAKYKMTRSKLCSLAEEFKAAGGEGIELISGKQAPEITANIVNIAKQYKLLGSCGSDFHFPNQPWQELGQFGSYPSDIDPVWSQW